MGDNDKPKKKLRDRRQFDYFECFESMVTCAAEESNLLLDCISNFIDAASLEARLEEAHGIEMRCDELVLDTIHAANEDFLPPIDREDIVELAIALDEITDRLEKCVKHLFMYNVKRIEPQSVEMCKLIHEECDLLVDAMGYFREFRKPKKLQARAEEVDKLENRIDSIYLYAIHDLFKEDVNMLRVIKWQAIFNTIEGCSDSIEHAVDLMVRIVVKNG